MICTEQYITPCCHNICECKYACRLRRQNAINNTAMDSLLQNLNQLILKLQENPVTHLPGTKEHKLYEFAFHEVKDNTDLEKQLSCTSTMLYRTLATSSTETRASFQGFVTDISKLAKSRDSFIRIIRKKRKAYDSLDSSPSSQICLVNEFPTPNASVLAEHAIFEDMQIEFENGHLFGLAERTLSELRS